MDWRFWIPFLAIDLVFTVIVAVWVVHYFGVKVRHGRLAYLKELLVALRGGQIVSEGSVFQSPVLESLQGSRTVRVWFSRQSGGKNSPPRCFIHYEMDCRATFTFQFGRESVLGMIGLKLFQDIQCGIPEIDRFFKIKSDDETRAATFARSLAEFLPKFNMDEQTAGIQAPFLGLKLVADEQIEPTPLYGAGKPSTQIFIEKGKLLAITYYARDGFPQVPDDVARIDMLRRIAENAEMY